MLYLRAQMPGQGHQSGRRAGQGGDRAVHCLRFLHQGLPPGSQGHSRFHRHRERTLLEFAKASWPAWPLPFPAAFPQAKPGQIISAVRRLGFSEVMEVAFGADLVARAHARWAKTERQKLYISSPCPASGPLHQEILSFPGAQLDAHRLPDGGHGPGDQTGLPARRPRWSSSGPASPKKRRSMTREVAGDVDAVLTFVELDQMFQEAGLILEKASRKRSRWAHPPAGADLSGARGAPPQRRHEGRYLPQPDPGHGGERGLHPDSAMSFWKVRSRRNFWTFSSARDASTGRRFPTSFRSSPARSWWPTMSRPG